MNSAVGNFFKMPHELPVNFELFQSVISTESLNIERIISTGQKTPDNLWLEQDKNEWVILLQGESEMHFEDGNIKNIYAGDYIHIPKNTKHKVVRTSIDPPCIWLAVHY